MIEAKRQGYDQQKQHWSHPILGSGMTFFMGCEGPPLVSPTWDISTRGGKTMTYRWWLKSISTDLGLKHVWIHIWDRQVVSSSFFILSLGLAIDFFWFQLLERMQLIPTFQLLFPRGWGLQAVATCWAHRWKLQFWSQKRACSLAMLAMLGRGSSDHGDGLYLIWVLCSSQYPSPVDLSNNDGDSTSKNFKVLSRQRGVVVAYGV